MSLKDALGFYTPSPRVTAVQGAKSTTFKTPEANASLTIPELFKFHGENSQDHPVFVYADDDRQPRFLRYREVYRAIQKAATYASPSLAHLKDAYAKAGGGLGDADPPVVGILANTDSITFFTFIVGLMYLATTPFAISVRNSPIAIAHLVAKTGVTKMFVSADPANQRLAHEANEILAKEGRKFDVLPMPLFNDLYGLGGDEALVPMGPVSTEKTCIIMHSSGSTAFPKPIKFLDKNFRKWGSFFSYGDVDMCGVHLGGHTNPMFHGMGSLLITWTIYTGVIVAMFKPCNPPVVPTPEAFLDSIVCTRTEMLFCVPAFVEAWARSVSDVEKVKALRLIIYCGAPMNKQIGDRLISEGVALTPLYGCTEIGTLVRLIPDPETMDRSEWDWFEVSPHINGWLIPQEDQPGIFEPVVLDCDTFTPNVFNSTFDGRPGYATSDLLQQHPTKPHLFRVFGRADDQLMLSTGEKTNPAPLEAILLQDPHVHACLMFGRGRLQNGVLIQPTEQFDPRDEARLEEFRNKIWPSVEKMNAYAPAHSRIFKETIIVNDPAKPLEYTAKGTPRRQVCIAAYEPEIDALYARVEQSSQKDLPLPRDWSLAVITEYVGDLVRKVMKNSALEDTSDIFLEGCDSLQVTWIRNTVIHALRSSSTVDIHGVPSSFVYTHPTIASLAAYVSSLATSELKEGQGSANTAEIMRALLETYSGGLVYRFPALVNGQEGRASTSETVIVTGTTGRLGSHLLVQLLARQDVQHVYALNRATASSTKSLDVRSREAFRMWGLDESLLDSEKVSFHVANLTQPQLGLEVRVYEEMKKSVTQIIHNGWRVDFNVALSSFETLIAGSRKLLDLALNSALPGGPRVLFVSSISSVRNHPASTPAPETLDVPPEMAVGSGYPESKWVTEQLFRRAAEQTGLRTTSVRVGQVCGDRHAGGWGTSEWVPALVKISQRLGAIPSRDEEVSWVPVDVVAATLQEMATSGEPVLHLVTPRPVPWDTLFRPIAARLGLPLVPYADWLARVERSAADARAQADGAGAHDSAHSLLEFFRNEGMRFSLSTDRAVRCSPALADAQPLGPEDAERWLEFWGKVEYIKV